MSPTSGQGPFGCALACCQCLCFSCRRWRHGARSMQRSDLARIASYVRPTTRTPRAAGRTVPSSPSPSPSPSPESAVRSRQGGVPAFTGRAGEDGARRSNHVVKLTNVHPVDAGQQHDNYSIHPPAGADVYCRPSVNYVSRCPGQSCSDQPTTHLAGEWTNVDGARYGTTRICWAAATETPRLSPTSSVLSTGRRQHEAVTINLI